MAAARRQRRGLQHEPCRTSGELGELGFEPDQQTGDEGAERTSRRRPRGQIKALRVYARNGGADGSTPSARSHSRLRAH